MTSLAGKAVDFPRKNIASVAHFPGGCRYKHDQFDSMPWIELRKGNSCGGTIRDPASSENLQKQCHTRDHRSSQLLEKPAARGMTGYVATPR